MKTLHSVFLVILATLTYAQSVDSDLVDSIHQNQIHISSISDNLRNGISPSLHKIIGHGASLNCNDTFDIISQIGDSLYMYNLSQDTSRFLTKIVQGISASFGYIKNLDVLITGANWDSIYYYRDTSWVFSGYHIEESSDLIHTGGGLSTSYFMGGNLWYFNGSSTPKIIRSEIKYAVADLVVDDEENAWVITGQNWPRADTLRVIDSTGVSICDIPFKESVNTLNGYGMTIYDGKIYVGFGSQNLNYPNSIVPLNISIEENEVEFGEPISINSNLNIDFAGCSKLLELPNCKITSSIETQHQEGIGIWPNPFSDDLFIESGTNNIGLIEVFDTYGTKIYSRESFLNGIVLIDLDYIPSGMYILSLYDMNRIQINKVIIKE